MISFVEFIVFMLMFALMFVVGESIPQAFGGSFFLVVLISLISVGGYWLRTLKFQLLLLEIILLTILGGNYLHYLLVVDVINIKETFQLLTLLLIVLSILIESIIHSLLNESKGLINTKQNFIMLTRFYNWSAIVYSIVISIVFLGTADSNAKISNDLLVRMVPVSFIALLMFPIAMLIHMKKWGEYKLDYITKKGIIPDNSSIGFINKIYIYVMTAVVSTGTLFEYLHRKDWVFWIGNIIFISLFFMVIGKIARHCKEMPIKKITDEKSWRTPLLVIRVSIINFLVIIFIVILTICFLGFS